MNINTLKRDKAYIENHIGDIPISRLMRLYDKYANGSDMYLLGAEYDGKVYGKFYKHIPNRYITTQTGHKENNQYCRCRLHKWGAKELANAKGSFCIGTIEDIYKLHNNKGYCFEDAERMAKEYARTVSVRCEEYWRRRGYSEDEIERKKLEMNPSSVFFYDNVDEYISHFKKASDVVKKTWKSKYMNYCLSGIKEGKFKSVSKSEKMIFDFLISNVNKDIKHEPYIVLIPEERRNETVNSYFYVCDGYLNVDGGVILIEFDGVMYHKSDKDEQRDYDILSIDPNVLGIIHIKQETKLSKSWYKIKCLQINEAIQEITNTTKSRIYI